jgi:hypothetical protein
MTCSHSFIRRPTTGQRDTCSLCQVEFIHDGTKWRWLYDLSPAKRAKLERTYRIDALTGKHS